MCGIVGYVGRKPAVGILIEGLKRLEYRGYDSAGVAIVDAGAVHVRKSPGRISNLSERLEADPAGAGGTVGIAHTRWATHGAPTEPNAHPHTDCAGRIAIVHNGIVENYADLRKVLIDKGHTFTSQTDSEVLAHLISEFYRHDGCKTIEQAVQLALHEVTGTYGLAVICLDEPDKLVAARKGSPLIVGVGADEYLVASDASAIVEHTVNVVYLNDNEMVVLSPDGMRTLTTDNVPVSKQVQQIEWSLEQIALAGHDHFMAKEIAEQPDALGQCMSGRLQMRDGRIQLGGIEQLARELVKTRRIILTGCGTAWHAGLIGEYLFEDLARIPTEVEYLAALREARQKGALALGVVNAVGSTIARETDAGVYLHVGPEIGVASTKAFTAQVVVMAMMSLYLGRRRFMPEAVLREYIDALAAIPSQIEEVLAYSDQVAAAAAENTDRPNWLFLGRGYNYPVALEGALKLKEISYLHAEGLPAAEMKHGPIALINDGMPVVAVAPRSSTYEKIIGNIEEVRARGGRVIAVATAGDENIRKYAEHVFYVPDCPEPLQPLLTVIPLQLLAYHVAVALGCNVDKPRNLAKSVTVE